MVPAYLRRAAEIEMALMTDWLYIRHKSTQGVIDFFKGFAKVLNFADFELVEPVIINYKKLMPTINELTVISDLAKSRNKFINSTVINNKISRKTFYKVLRETPSIDLVLMPKTKIIITDALIKFLDNMETLLKNFEEISLNCYALEE